MHPGMQRIGKYELQKHLGSGKMGEVWIGYDAQAQRPVTLRVFSTSLPLDSQEVAQFRQHAWRVASLRHPGIARIFDLSLSPSNDPTSSTGSRIFHDGVRRGAESGPVSATYGEYRQDATGF